jgi:hypothetical protein
LKCTIYTGEKFDNNVSAIVPTNARHTAALWAFCQSDQFRAAVRQLDQKMNVTNATLVKVGFDLETWSRQADQSVNGELPAVSADDPTQWVFGGQVESTEYLLGVAVAQLLGFRWPRQHGTRFIGCAPLNDSPNRHVDVDGIVCIPSAKGEPNAAARVLSLVTRDSSAVLWQAKFTDILRGAQAASLDDWLRDMFFSEHCDLFHQRPFIWQIWDGVKDGFSALVNYHRLAAPNGEGRKTLEKLLYSYLGDWIERQRSDVKRNVEAAELKLAAAEHLASELEKILHGEPPYDLFVRWKPLHEQPVGWEPDINDGVRINIRPFMMARPFKAKGKNACILRATPNIKWTKDRGKEPMRPKEDYPWFWSWDEQTLDFSGGREFDGNRWNDLHYTRAFKEAARERHAAQRRMR